MNQEVHKAIPNLSPEERSTSPNDKKKPEEQENNNSVDSPDSIDADDDLVIAPITIAPDGGWGWVVVTACFWNIFCVEGIGYSFGAMKGFIMEDLQKDIASVAVINSITVGFMCFFGPIASALINRFGFRITSMIGAVISTFSAFMAAVGGNYTILLIFYGACMGLGFSLTDSSSSLIVGFYFQKKRALATALTLCGNSLGVSVMAPVFLYLNTIDWRSTVMLQSAMLGTMFFTSMVFRPLLSITVQVVSEHALKSKFSTPYLSQAQFRQTRRKSVVNKEYKRAVDLVVEQQSQSKELLMESDQRRRTSKVISTMELRSLSRKFSKLQDIYGLEQQTDKLLITIHNEEGKRKGCCDRLFSWTPHVKEARPLYRDDAFYNGNVNKLAENSSNSNLSEDEVSGLDYNLAVSRVTTAKDMKEKKGICSTAVKRVLVTMADPRLLRLKSFRLFLLGIFFSFSGLIIPYVYVIDRSKAFKLPKKHYQWFVSAIAVSGLFGRIIIGIVATKVPPVYCAQVSAFMTGLSCIVSNYLTVYQLQYVYCTIFGFFMSGVVVSRYLILVDLYGLEFLTNGAGLMMLTQGLAFLLTLPAAGLILTRFGVFFTFVYSGICCFCGAVSFCLVPIVRKYEK